MFIDPESLDKTPALVDDDLLQLLDYCRKLEPSTMFELEQRKVKLGP